MDDGRPLRSGRRIGLTLPLLVAMSVAAIAFPPGPVSAAPDEEACFVQRSHHVFLDRSATSSEIANWTALFAAGAPRHQLPDTLARSDEWLTVEVTALYQQALDRGPDATGLAYWVDQLRRGAMVTRIGSQVYGSDEFYARAGGTDDGFVTDLYARILHRAPDSSGLAFWSAQVAPRGRPGVAAAFLASSESRRDRVIRLYDEILGRAPDASGLAYWVEQLAVVNDVRLAVQLAASGEFFTRAQVGCELPPPATVTFTGHGWGHGRGMGQYGALGYAIDHDWTGAQILDHFYGGTTTVTRPDDVTQRVYLVGSDGVNLDVTQASGHLQVTGFAGTYRAVSVRRLSASTFRVYGATTASCTPAWTQLGETTATDVAVSSTVAQGDAAEHMLRHCRTGRTYRGALRAVRADRPGDVDFTTINEVATELMLRSIVPAEMPASWATLGGGKGAAALRAQAVAARSYALSGDTRWAPWATTCDSTACQVYAGVGSEHPLSTAAVVATALQVRQFSGGAIARTEFSSSTGGWTVDGTSTGGFPAVVDEGDDTSGNARHTWTVVLPASQVEAAFDDREGQNMGTFLGFDSYDRNGLGEWGGRVRSLRARFTGGDVTLSGEQLRSLLDLNSSWFLA